MIVTPNVKSMCKKTTINTPSSNTANTNNMDRVAAAISTTVMASVMMRTVVMMMTAVTIITAVMIPMSTAALSAGRAPVILC